MSWLRNCLHRHYINISNSHCDSNDRMDRHFVKIKEAFCNLNLDLPIHSMCAIYYSMMMIHFRSVIMTTRSEPKIKMKCEWNWNWNNVGVTKKKEQKCIWRTRNYKLQSTGRKSWDEWLELKIGKRFYRFHCKNDRWKQNHSVFVMKCAVFSTLQLTLPFFESILHSVNSTHDIHTWIQRTGNE